MIRTLFLLLAWFVAVPAFSQGKVVSSAKQQQGESDRLKRIEERLHEQQVQFDKLKFAEKGFQEQLLQSEIQRGLIEEQKQLVQKEYDNLKDYKGMADTELYIIGILGTIVGIVLPVIGIIIGISFFAGVKRQKREVENGVNELNNWVKETRTDIKSEQRDFKDWVYSKKGEIDIEQKEWMRKLARTIYEKNKQLEEDAKTKLSKIVSEAEKEWQRLKEIREAEELLRTGNLASLSGTVEVKSEEQSSKEGKVKFDFSQQAEQINKSEYATPFQKAMAKALELYFSNNDWASIEQHLMILEKYSSELTLNELPSFYYRIAYSYAVLVKDDSAIEYYEKVVKLDPRNSDAWNNLGSSYMNKNKKNEAIKCFKKAMEIDEDALVCCNLGIAYFKNDNPDNAIEMFNKAIGLKPKYVEAWSSLGSVYVSKGDYDTAIMKYNEAVRLKPDYALALANLTELQIILNRNAEETLSKLKVAVNTEEDRFDHQLLETIRNAKSKIFTGTVSDAIEKLRQAVGGDANKVTWNFKQLNGWLAREKANPTALDKEPREFITDLIQRIEEWRGSQPKAE